MRPCDIQDGIGFGCLVIGLIIGAGGALLGVLINSKLQDIESRISAIELQAEENVKDIKFFGNVASQAWENSIRAHKRINRVNVEIGSDEQPQ